MFKLKVCLKLKQKLSAPITVEAAMWKFIHKEELKMTTWTTFWKRKHTHTCT